MGGDLFLQQPYIFRATCTNVVDGDTIDCDIDVGFGMRTRQRLRLHGVNTPELRSSDPDKRLAAIEAKRFTERFALGCDLYIQTYKSDVFGRYLAKIYRDSECLNDLLVSEGHAVPFMEETALLR